ncbi:hypothetical protein DFH06DRAFT_1147167 [Mycena polygramma]|nr:hypothetical protein DFH06DRAFT_1147167 [Mycena polygramma]
MSAQEATVATPSFPAEILGEVFLACIPIPGNRDKLPAYFPWTVSHVCHHWRASALAFPKLWSFLEMEQTQENQEPGDADATLDFMQTYLARSGTHPLTFHLTYTYETLHYQPFLECLGEHTARWQNVSLQSPNLYALEYLAQGEPAEYPMLRSLECSYANMDSDAVCEGPIFAPIPLAQLTRYREYECSWRPDNERQWEIIAQLSAMVDFRASFYGERDDDEAVEMPHLRFASLAVDSHAEELGIDEIINCFAFPGIQGLNLKLTANHSLGVLFPMPDQLRGLRILRLCGALAISKASLPSILTELPLLVDLAVELRGLDAEYLFTFLSPSSLPSVLVPRLRALRLHRVTEFERSSGTVDALLSMLTQRFGGVQGKEFTPLKRFELSLHGEGPSELSDEPTLMEILRLRRPLDGPTRTAENPVSMLESLESMRVREGWDIRVKEWWNEFWNTEMDGEFL